MARFNGWNLLWLSAFIFGGAANATQDSSRCFDFTKPVREPLHAIIPLAKAGKADATASGKISGKGLWAAARGLVELPLAEVYKKFLDHYTVKDPKRVKLQVYDQDQEGYANFKLVMVELKPAPMITLNWEENWGYVVTEGTAEKPSRMVISYEKTAGSKFIGHLCGSIVLSSAKPGATDVFLYEEIEAFGKRSGKETEQGHLGTLATLRKGARGLASTH